MTSALDGQVISISRSGRISALYVGGEPAKMLLTRDSRLLYVVNPDADEIEVIDTATDTLRSRISVHRPGYPYRGSSPNSLALSPNGAILYTTLTPIGTIPSLSTSCCGKASSATSRTHRPRRQRPERRPATRARHVQSPRRAAIAQATVRPAQRGARNIRRAASAMGISVTVQIVAAFVDERDGGNLAGVVLDRSDLAETHMQSIAAQLGYSETAFLTEVADGFRFDVFTPVTRVADCGHATVAAFGVLAQHERFAQQTLKHTINGPREIRLDAEGRVFMLQPAPLYVDGPDPRTVAASLGLSESTVFAAPPVVARHDAAFLLVPVSHVGMLAAIVPNMRAIEAISRTLDVLGYYVFALLDDTSVDATARMFAPLAGIPEESATGMAAGLLGARLYDQRQRSGERFAFDQGVFMKPPEPSRLNVQLVVRDERLTGIWVGGHARTREVRLVDVRA